MTTTDTKGTGQYADVNGVHLYYETYGVGKPLILLHGGLGSGEMFGPILAAFAEGRQLIAPDLQGHGRTADIDRPLSVELMPTTLPSSSAISASRRLTSWATRSVAGSRSSRRRSIGSWSDGSSSSPPMSGATRSTPRCSASRPRSARRRPRP